MDRITSAAALTLTPQEAALLAAAIDGLAAQLTIMANRMIHGPKQAATCHAIGTLRALERRLAAATAAEVEPAG